MARYSASWLLQDRPGVSAPIKLSAVRVGSGQVKLSSFANLLTGLPAGALFAYSAQLVDDILRTQWSDGSTRLLAFKALPGASSLSTVANFYTPLIFLPLIGSLRSVAYAVFSQNTSLFSHSGSFFSTLQTGTAGLTWLALINLGASCAVETWLWYHTYGFPFMFTFTVAAKTDGAVEFVRFVAGTGTDTFALPAGAVPRNEWVLLACRQRLADDRLEVLVNNTVVAVSTGSLHLVDVPTTNNHNLRVMMDPAISQTSGKLPVKLHTVAYYDRTLSDAELQAIQPPVGLLGTNS